MKKRTYILYIVVIWIVLIVPFAGMSFWKTDETTENRELSKLPSLKEDGKWNAGFLNDMGIYFEDHLAFRLPMLTANACIWGETLKTSTTDRVVVGKGDWLYFGGTVDDYMGRDILSERELYAVVHNLLLMKTYIEERGGAFLLMVAPNKNTLYSGGMPYYYQKGDDSNLKRLNSLLEKEGIAYVDLVKAFKNEDEVLYFHRDTHWNNKGAKSAYHTAMDELGKSHETYLNVPVRTEKDHVGDIDRILYPLAARKEDNIYYDKAWKYHYVNEVSDNMDAWIETGNPDKQGCLLMYRDSFGESMLPFFADEYGQAYFSRLVPYNLENVDQYHPDTVIVERTERQIEAFAVEIPVMEGPRVENMSPLEKDTDTTLEVGHDGSYTVISGSIDEKYLSNNAEIYAAISDIDRRKTSTYQTFYTLKKDGDGNGYFLYLKEESLPSDNIHINIIVEDDQGQWIVQSRDERVIWGQEER